MNFTDFFSLILPGMAGFFAIIVTVGSVVAFRQSYSKQVLLMKNEMIKTLNDEIAELKKEQQRQKRQIATMRYAFKEQGIRIKVNGEFITLTNTRTGRRRIIPIQEEVKQLEKESEEEENTNGGDEDNGDS
jgi:nitrogen fixation protein FixH